MKNIVMPAAYKINAIVRALPNFLTNFFAPSLMPKEYLKKAKANPYGIAANRTNQAVCAKYCGNCPSNPFTHGGLYCISGKSKKEVEEKGCNCFDCKLFDQCGGGKGYFCKFGSAADLNNPVPGELSEEAILDRKGKSEDEYHHHYIKALIDENEKQENEQKKQQLRQVAQKELAKEPHAIETRTINVTYDGEKRTVATTNDKTILEISKANRIPHVHACGGKAKCSTCRVLVLSGLSGVLERNEQEKKMAKKKSFSANIRLSCQTRPTSDVVIRRLVVNETQIEEAIAEGRLYPGPFGLDKNVTVMFSDIRSFTSFSENSLPYDIVHILNDYFETVCAPIDKYNGYIDKYMGDGIMATFGITAPYDNGYQGAIDAMRASFEMLEKLKEFNKEFYKKYNHRFTIGIGLHSGEAVLAKLGFKRKRQFTAIGDTVNTASRIESSTKEHQTQLLVSQKIYELVKKEFIWGREIIQNVRGKTDALKLYEPLKKRQ